MKEWYSDEKRQFHNRCRILMNLDADAYPPELRDDNPTSAGLWMLGRENRIAAFLFAPDAIADAIWVAVLAYEAEGRGR